MKKFIVAFGLVFAFCFSSVGALHVELTPSYADARFEPADKLHAGCVHDAQVTLVADRLDLESAHLELVYQADDLQILRLDLDVVEWASYDLEYDRIIFDIKNLNNEKENIDLFRLHFKSVESLRETLLELVQESYLVTDYGEKLPLRWEFTLSFAEVSECQPDIIPPSVVFVHPGNESKNISLDSKFVFTVKDVGKGIDKKNVYVNLDGIVYSGKDLSRNGTSVTLYPQTWLPVDQDILIGIHVSDLQTYGGPNVIDKQFKVSTASGVLLDGAISLEELRSFAQNTHGKRGTQGECALLRKMHSKADVYYRYKLKRILKKLECPILDEEIVDLTLWIDSNNGSTEVDEEVELISEFKVTKVQKAFSVFGVMWWVLFVIVLILKIHYFHGYHKYKKRAKKV